MSLLTTIEICSKQYPYMSKEQLAEKIAENFLAASPDARALNTSTLRHFIFNVLSYNKTPGDDPNCSPYTICRASSLTVPFGNGDKLTLVSSKDGLVLKVCPVCKMTAQVGDPLCPNCNHNYRNCEEEAVTVTAAVRSLHPSDGESVKILAAQVVLDDEEEGFRVTEGDIDKAMHNIKKYIPQR